MNLDPLLQTFIVESRELLQAMEEGLYDLEHTDDYDLENTHDRDEYINAIFRAAHTIKGSAGLFGLDGIVAFTHVAESVLDRVRGGEVAMDQELVALFLACGDHIAGMIDALEAGQEPLDDDNSTVGADLVAKLSRYLEPAKGGAGPSAEVMERTASGPVERLGEENASTDNWHISLRFSADVLRQGMDPLSFLRYMGTLGHITGISTLHDGIPPLAEMDPESCYLGYEISFHSEADKATIEGIFDFVRDDALIKIIPPHSRIGDYLRVIQELPEEDLMIGQILLRCGTFTERELARIIDMQNQASESGEKPLLGELAVSEGIVAPQVVDAALEKQKQVKESKVRESSVVKVDAERLDYLINLVGELVIAGASSALLSKRCGDPRLQEAASNVSRLVEEIRDGALQLRMVPVGETFKRFNRVVRDVSRDLGKEIELSIGGAETELDKSVIDRIGEPLTHLVRNSMDHGIEAVETRLAQGKPAKGTVRLDAYHESGSIVIEVGDDGAGLNKERILRKAVERGIVESGATLSEKEIHHLIFAPGFSTAEQVTNISGRGVGMDVVRRDIEALRGSIELESQEGAGSTVRIRLPLTLAIIDGFLLGVGDASYVVPLDMVVECMELSAAERRESQGRDFINLRGSALPLLRLRDQFQVSGNPGRRENVVVVQYGQQRAGFVVDELMGEFQTVIKPLGRLFDNLKGIGGSTILGSGEVALILDVPALIQQAMDRESRSPAARQ